MKIETDIFVRPLNDLCFKYVFSHEMILEDFINSFFDYTGKNYNFSFDYIKVEDSINPKNKDLKVYLCDLIAIHDNEVVINLEAYTSFGLKQFNKTFAYSTRLHNENILDTKTYKSIPVISINIMTGNYRKMNNKIVNTYMFNNACSNQNITRNIILYLVRIDMACKKSYNENEKRFITWLRFINSKSIGEIEELVKVMKGDYIMEKAMRFVKGFNKMSIEDGLPKVLEERYNFGYDDGETAGIAKGILETAKNMLKIGISVDKVVKATNLSKAKVTHLQRELES